MHSTKLTSIDLWVLDELLPLYHQRIDIDLAKVVKHAMSGGRILLLDNGDVVLVGRQEPIETTSPLSRSLPENWRDQYAKGCCVDKG